MQGRFMFDQCNEFLQACHDALLAQQLFQLIYRCLTVIGFHVREDERRLEQVEQVMVVEIALQRGEPTVKHRAHR